MSIQARNNSRIAQNTIFLYIRMLISMFVGLYTSRVILQTLGIQDYGIYNVVAGVIVMFSFVNSAMSTATSRFLTFALGVNDFTKLYKTFQTSLTIHLIIAVLIFLIGETLGLWFVFNQLQIPIDRFNAAFWVYQISILVTMVSIMIVPFNASIISHERMSAFAYISILDVVIKLLIVYLLVYIPFDKLIVYAILIFFAQTITQLIYVFYCKKHFKEVKIHFLLDKKLFKEMSVFAGWNLYGNLAYIAYSQGLNILLNIFFGPVINAARGIAVQVQSMIYSFITNFQTAMNPQLTKSYAVGDIKYMRQLIFLGSKFSFYLLLFMALPVFFETKYVLELWLVEVPEYTVPFLQIMLLINLTDTLSTPVAVAIQATGNVKNPQLITGTILLAILPVSYIALYLGGAAEFVFYVHLSCAIIAQFSRVIMLKNRTDFPLLSYLKSVIIPILAVLVLSIFLCSILKSFYLESTFKNFIVICLGSFIINIVVIYLVGLNRTEKLFIKNKLLLVYSKLK